MILTDEQRNELLEAAKPLMKFLCENCHPHTQVFVTGTGAELTEGICAVKTDEFLKD